MVLAESGERVFKGSGVQWRIWVCVEWGSLVLTGTGMLPEWPVLPESRSSSQLWYLIQSLKQIQNLGVLIVRPPLVRSKSNQNTHRKVKFEVVGSGTKLVISSSTDHGLPIVCRIRSLWWASLPLIRTNNQPSRENAGKKAGRAASAYWSLPPNSNVLWLMYNSERQRRKLGVETPLPVCASMIWVLRVRGKFTRTGPDTRGGRNNQWCALRNDCPRLFNHAHCCNTSGL